MWFLFTFEKGREVGGNVLYMSYMYIYSEDPLSIIYLLAYVKKDQNKLYVIYRLAAI